MQIAPVCSLAISPAQLTDYVSAEVAISLNDNKSQIYVKEGKEWMPTETLAEVCHTTVPRRNLTIPLSMTKSSRPSTGLRIRTAS